MGRRRQAADWNPEGEQQKSQTGQDWQAQDANGEQLTEGDTVKNASPGPNDDPDMTYVIIGYFYPQIKIKSQDGEIGYAMPSGSVKVATKRIAHGGVSATEQGGNLVITVDPDTQAEVKALVDSGDTSDNSMWNLFDTPGFMGSGYMSIPPEDTGALTSAPMIGCDIELGEDGHFQFTPESKLWWYPLYESRSPLEDLAESGQTVFQNAGKVEKKSAMKRKASDDLQIGDEVEITYEPEKGQRGIIDRIEGDKYYLKENPGDVSGGAWYYATDLEKVGMKRMSSFDALPAIEDCDFDVIAEPEDSHPSDMGDPKAKKEYYMGKIKEEAAKIVVEYGTVEKPTDADFNRLLDKVESVANDLNLNWPPVEDAIRGYSFVDIEEETGHEYPTKLEPSEIEDILAYGYDDEVPYKEIIERANNGDEWAWCTVHVICKWTDDDGEEYTGDDYLVGVSAKSSSDFKMNGGYYEDMKQQAYDEMIKSMPAPTAMKLPGIEGRKARIARRNKPSFTQRVANKVTKATKYVKQDRMSRKERRAKAALMKKKAEADWNEIVEYLKNRSVEICKDNGCDLENDNHNCESYAYITANGQLLDVSGADYFAGTSDPYAAISLPFTGTGDDLKNEVEEQTFEEESEVPMTDIGREPDPEAGPSGMFTGAGLYFRKARQRGDAYGSWIDKYSDEEIQNLPCELDGKVYNNFSELQKEHPEITSIEGGGNYFGGMRGEVNGKDAIRFESHSAYRDLSASCPPGLSKDVKEKVKKEYGPDNPNTYKTLWKIKDQQKKSSLDAIATCPPGLSKDVKEKVKEEYGPDDPRTYKTLWTIKDKQEGKKGSVRKTADDELMSRAMSCPVCSAGVVQMNPDLLCSIGQKMFREEIEGMGGEVTDPNYGKVTASKEEPIKIGHEVFVKDLGISAYVKMIEGGLITVSSQAFGEHYYVVGDDNIIRRRRRYATDEQEINDLERMKFRIEQQKKETIDETQMRALEERLHELDMEIGRANAKQAMYNPHFWDKAGAIEDGNEKKLRSPASEEVSEEGHNEQKMFPSKGEPGEGTEFRSELASYRRAKRDTRGQAFHDEVQAATYGYQINMMDIPKVYEVAEQAFDAGQNVTDAVHAILDQIAIKTGSRRRAESSTYGPDMEKGNYLHIWDNPVQDLTEDSERVEKFNARVQELMESGMSEDEAQHKAMDELPAIASSRRAEETQAPTMGGVPENIEKADGAEKVADLDPDMFKDETQKKMEANPDAVAGPKGKGRDWNGGGYISTSPSVGPSAMPGQEE